MEEFTPSPGNQSMRQDRGEKILSDIQQQAETKINPDNLVIVKDAPNQQFDRPGEKSEAGSNDKEFNAAGQRLMEQLTQMEKLGGIAAEVARQYKAIKPGEGQFSGVQLTRIPPTSENAQSLSRIGLDSKGLISMRIDIDALAKTPPAEIQASLVEEWRHIKDMQRIARNEGRPRLMTEAEGVQSEVAGRTAALEAYKLIREQTGIIPHLEPIFNKVQSIDAQASTGALSPQTAESLKKDALLNYLNNQGYGTQVQRDKDLMKAVSGALGSNSTRSENVVIRGKEPAVQAPFVAVKPEELQGKVEARVAVGEKDIKEVGDKAKAIADEMVGKLIDASKPKAAVGSTEGKTIQELQTELRELQGRKALEAEFGENPDDVRALDKQIAERQAELKAQQQIETTKQLEAAAQQSAEQRETRAQAIEALNKLAETNRPAFDAFIKEFEKTFEPTILARIDELSQMIEAKRAELKSLEGGMRLPAAHAEALAKMQEFNALRDQLKEQMTHKRSPEEIAAAFELSALADGAIPDVSPQDVLFAWTDANREYNDASVDASMAAEDRLVAEDRSRFPDPSESSPVRQPDQSDGNKRARKDPTYTPPPKPANPETPVNPRQEGYLKDDSIVVGKGSDLTPEFRAMAESGNYTEAEALAAQQLQSPEARALAEEILRREREGQAGAKPAESPKPPPAPPVERSDRPTVKPKAAEKKPEVIQPEQPETRTAVPKAKEKPETKNPEPVISPASQSPARQDTPPVSPSEPGNEDVADKEFEEPEVVIINPNPSKESRSDEKQGVLSKIANWFRGGEKAVKPEGSMDDPGAFDAYDVKEKSTPQGKSKSSQPADKGPANFGIDTNPESQRESTIEERMTKAERQYGTNSPEYRLAESAARRAGIGGYGIDTKDYNKYASEVNYGKPAVENSKVTWDNLFQDIIEDDK